MRAFLPRIRIMYNAECKCYDYSVSESEEDETYSDNDETQRNSSEHNGRRVNSTTSIERPPFRKYGVNDFRYLKVRSVTSIVKYKLLSSLLETRILKHKKSILVAKLNTTIQYLFTFQVNYVRFNKINLPRLLFLLGSWKGEFWKGYISRIKKC